MGGIRIIAGTNDLRAQALYQRYMAEGSCPIEYEGVNVCILTNAIMRESTYILDLSMDGLDPSSFTWPSHQAPIESAQLDDR